MIKKETFELLKMIQAVFTNFDITQEKIDTWTVILKEYEFEEIKANYIAYIQTAKFAPKPSDIIKIKNQEHKVAPNIQETRAYWSKYKQDSLATKEEREFHLKEMRNILGIER
ncbi:replicative helicase loader/inhibitor [Bacillus cereus]